MTPPLSVSVVIPVFNGASHIASAVQSILNQSYRDFELVIVDDGSTDSTAAVLAGFTDPRIRVLRSAHVGLIPAREIGIRAAAGTWIAWMDADDLCHPERLERQLGFLKAHPECLFVGTTYSIITPGGHYLNPRDRFGWRYLEPVDITRATTPFADPSGMFGRAKALNVGLFDADFPSEKPLWYKLLRQGRGAILGEPLYWYRWYLNSFSRPTDNERAAVLERADAGVRVRYDPEHSAAHHHESPRLRQPRTRLATKTVDYYLLAGDYASARATAIAVWKRWPLNSRTIKLVILALLRIRSLRHPWSPKPARDWFERAELPAECLRLDSALGAPSRSQDRAGKPTAARPTFQPGNLWSSHE